MRIPIATYRLQLNNSFTFNDAGRVVPYLSKLGVSDIYFSPVFASRKGSPHGYDVVDPTRLNPELGPMEDFNLLVNQVKSEGLGWLQDIVPNHMAFDPDNEMLMHVLEYGHRSQYFGYFDINWNHQYESMKGRLLTPFLGKFYSEALESGEVRLVYRDSSMYVVYYNFYFPLTIPSYYDVLTPGIDQLEAMLGTDHPDYINFVGVISTLHTISEPLDIDEHYAQVNFIKNVLWELYSGNKVIRDFVDHNIRSINGNSGNNDSYALFDKVLGQQLFRLSFWKVATEEINYRRFFSINDLISLRVEVPEVFDHVHSLVINLVKQGVFTGLRVDHIDGLYNPREYLKRLKEKTGDTYIVVEKILQADENLPVSWPVEGTTGYDYLGKVNGIFCRRTNVKRFDRIYSAYIGRTLNFLELCIEKKLLILEKHMGGDVENLAYMFKNVSNRYRYGSDMTLYGLKRAIREVMAVYPVYRTYISEKVFDEHSKSYIKLAIERAKERMPGMLHELNFVERFLLLVFEGQISAEEKHQWIGFVMRFQQFTGPLVAKGFEDTLLYVYNRLISLNEVGGDPDQFGVALEGFHKFNLERSRSWPHSLNATSTHDTKRGEDARARINVISELPGEWEKRVKLWTKLNNRFKTRKGNRVMPDANDEYFLYQTMIGTLPFAEENYSDFCKRLKRYIIKAVREAKVHTAWLKPDEEYEAAYLNFVEALLDRENNRVFWRDFLPFQEKIASYGIWNSLSQLFLKIMSPGVPDTYQGTELWDLSFVDPDNRRAVDFRYREELLDNVINSYSTDKLDFLEDLVSNPKREIIKLFLMYKSLDIRKNNIEIFNSGGYIPLRAGGKWQPNICAFARRFKKYWVLVIAPRFFTSIIDHRTAPLGKQVWADTYIRLPKEAPRHWQELVSGTEFEADHKLYIGDILSKFSVGCLKGEEYYA